MSEEEQPLEDKIKAAAKEQGWQEGGELDAFEFVVRGSQFHRDLKKTVDELKEENSRVHKIVAEHITSTSKRDYDNQKQTLEQQIAQAKEDGDTDRAVELAERKASLKEPEEVKDPKVDMIETWVSKQPWWSDETMRRRAMGLYQGEVLDGGDDPERILPIVEKEMQKLFPDYFKPKNPNRDKGAGDGGGPVKRKNEVDLDDLDEDERKHFDQFVAMGMDKKKLLKSISERRAQRAV